METGAALTGPSNGMTARVFSLCLLGAQRRGTDRFQTQLIEPRQMAPNFNTDNCGDLMGR
jgi:hypothetical protein